MVELVEEGVTGTQFTAGNQADLVNAVRRMISDEAGLRRMRINARVYFEAHLTETSNFAQLMRIYESVTGTTHGLRSRQVSRRPIAGATPT
jgi:glycosyltransferase involved in cell wall biosynthesis